MTTEKIPTQEESTKATKTPVVKVENEKTAAILAYFLVGIIWYFVDEKMKKSTFAKFHVKQSINLILASIALGVILTALTATILLIPLVLILTPITSIALFVVAIMGLINAINGKEKEVPIIGVFADKYLTF